MRLSDPVITKCSLVMVPQQQRSHKSDCDATAKDRVFTNGTCLDLGCGDGVGSAAFVPHFMKVVTIDLSKEMIAQAKARHQEQQRDPGRGLSSTESDIALFVQPAEAVLFLEILSYQPSHLSTSHVWYSYVQFWSEHAYIIESGSVLTFCVRSF